MSTLTYTINTTTSTVASYSAINALPGVTALTVTGFGTGFTYDANGDLIGGFLEASELSVTFSVTLPEVGTLADTFVYHEFFGLNQDIAAALAESPEVGQFREVLELEVLDLAELDITEVLQLFTFDADGKIATAPNPTTTYFTTTGPITGTMQRDEIQFVDTNARVDTRAGDDIVFVEAQSGHVRATLGAGDDVFVGAGSFFSFGPSAPGAPTSWVNGAVGNDILFGGDGADELRGMQDNDLLVGLNGDDRLLGGSGHDELFGGGGVDRIFAGVGRDVIDGGLGNDHLQGGLGRDVFLFDIVQNSDFSDPDAVELDTVYDFTVGQDTLHFRANGFDVNRFTAFDIFDSNSVQDGADTVFTYQGGTINLRGTTKADITVDSFYDKFWLLQSEFDLFDRLDSVLA